jgi:hypothetical protein
MKRKPGFIRQIMLAGLIAVTSAISLSGCAWFQGHHPDPNADSAHMNDYDHDHAATDHSGDRHDDANTTDPGPLSH